MADGPDNRVAGLDARLAAMVSELRAYGCEVHVSGIVAAGTIVVADTSALHYDPVVLDDGRVRFQIYCHREDEPRVRASLARVTGVGDPAE